MTERRESVKIELVDGFTSEAAKIVAAMAAIRQAADGLDGKKIDVDRDLDRFGKSAQKATKDVVAFTRTVDSGEKSIDKFSGRLSLIGQALATLGPGLVPIGAVGIPALTGLASAAGAAGLAVGALVAAAQGVGDAITAVDDFQLEPTAANAEKARLAIEGLAPAARAFVAEFQDFQPVLTDIRDAAAEGWFPGLTNSLDNLAEVGPQVETIFRRIGEAGGGAIEQATESLASERWSPFLDFLAQEMPDALTSLLTITGDLAHGATEMWQSFDPGNDAFLGWLANVADGFDRWASSSEGRDDIEGLLEYVREVGPGVQDFFTSLVGALTDVTQAAAPLGGPVLKTLTAVLDSVSAIADSDFGTPILAGVAALSILNRTLATTAALQKSAFGQAAGLGAGAGGRSLGGYFGRQVGSVKAAGAALLTVTSAQERATTSAQKLAAAEAEKTRTIRRGIGVAARAAGPIAALGVVSSGVADNIGLQNTAMFGLLGTIAGPWGAAVGAGVGLFQDFRHAGEEVESMMSRLDNTVSLGGLNFDEASASIASARTELEGMQSDFYNGNPLANAFSPEFWKEGLSGLTSGTAAYADELEAVNSQNDELVQTQDALYNVGRTLGQDYSRNADGSIAHAIEDMRTTAERAAPAIAALGYSWEQIAGMGREEQLSVGAEIRDWLREADSAAGRLGHVGDAMRALGGDALSTAAAAGQLESALAAFQDPALNAEEATDAWRESLARLRTEMKAGAGFNPLTEAGRENRALTRDNARDFKERISLMAAAGAGERELARAVAAGRREFIQSGIAAGFSREQMRKRANEMKLTPKLVQTVFRSLGISKVDLQVADLRKKYQAIPKRLQSEIRANGIPKTKAEVDALVKKYQLTEKERKALVTLVDAASGKAKAVNRLLDILNGRTPTPRADLSWDPLRSAVAAAQATLRSLDGQTANTYITTTHTFVTRKVNSGFGPVSAHGNIFPAQAFALGDVANRHMPEMARGGAVPRIWAEEETKGEAYIPLADDFRRPRAQALLAETASLIGMRAERYAQGAVSQGVRQPVNPARAAALSSPAFPSSIEVSGRLETPWGPAHIEGMTMNTIRRENSKRERFEHAMRGGRS